MGSFARKAIIDAIHQNVREFMEIVWVSSRSSIRGMFIDESLPYKFNSAMSRGREPKSV